MKNIIIGFIAAVICAVIGYFGGSAVLTPEAFTGWSKFAAIAPVALLGIFWVLMMQPNKERVSVVYTWKR